MLSELCFRKVNLDSYVEQSLKGGETSCRESQLGERIQTQVREQMQEMVGGGIIGRGKKM